MKPEGVVARGVEFFNHPCAEAEVHQRISGNCRGEGVGVGAAGDWVKWRSLEGGEEEVLEVTEVAEVWVMTRTERSESILLKTSLT